MTNTLHTCRICNATSIFPTFTAYEMMFGTREKFEYFQCEYCECLQITDVPNNLDRFYPPDYYSLSRPQSFNSSILKAFVLKQRFRTALFNRGHFFDKLLCRFIDKPDLRVKGVLPVISILQKAGIRDFSARFLDIGCGNWSDWLENLRQMGFKHLFGIDPFINSEAKHAGITISKNQINEQEGQFDLITFHHSLEHIPDQKATLASACQLLTPDGVLVVRIPTVSSFAWRHYGVDWVEMDPPRHLYLHSQKSIQILGDLVGLHLYSWAFDSNELEFYGSELYKKGIPLTGANLDIHFSASDFEKFKALAKQVNANGEGGRICLYFRKKTHHDPTSLLNSMTHIAN